MLIYTSDCWFQTCFILNQKKKMIVPKNKSSAYFWDTWLNHEKKDVPFLMAVASDLQVIFSWASSWCRLAVQRLLRAGWLVQFSLWLPSGNLT
jgi:hypothetical protein